MHWKHAHHTMVNDWAPHPNFVTHLLGGSSTPDDCVVQDRARQRVVHVGHGDRLAASTSALGAAAAAATGAGDRQHAEAVALGYHQQRQARLVGDVARGRARLTWRLRAGPGSARLCWAGVCARPTRAGMKQVPACCQRPAHLADGGHLFLQHSVQLAVADAVAVHQQRVRQLPGGFPAVSCVGMHGV